MQLALLSLALPQRSRSLLDVLARSVAASAAWAVVHVAFLLGGQVVLRQRDDLLHEALCLCCLAVVLFLAKHGILWLARAWLPFIMPRLSLKQR